MNDELREALWQAGPIIRPIIKGKAKALKGGNVVAEVEFTEPVSVNRAIYELSRSAEPVELDKSGRRIGPEAP